MASDLKNPLGRAGRIHQLLAALGLLMNGGWLFGRRLRGFIEVHMRHGPEGAVVDGHKCD